MLKPYFRILVWELWLAAHTLGPRSIEPNYATDYSNALHVTSDDAVLLLRLLTGPA